MGCMRRKDVHVIDADQGKPVRPPPFEGEAVSKIEGDRPAESAFIDHGKVIGGDRFQLEMADATFPAQSVQHAGRVTLQRSVGVGEDQDDGAFFRWRTVAEATRRFDHFPGGFRRDLRASGQCPGDGGTGEIELSGDPTNGDAFRPRHFPTSFRRGEVPAKP